MCNIGIPSSEAALEELISRVLRDIFMEGHVAKIADDLFCGVASPQKLAVVWRNVLPALTDNSLRLFPSKTVICP